MNGTSLARMYDRLTVWERIPLLIAANARQDDTEYQRLFDAAPRRAWRMSDHLLAEQALHVLAMIYITEQLDAAAMYFFAQFQMTYDPQQKPWLLATESCAYFFTVNADAWKRFCAELSIAPDALLAANHHGWFLPFCEGQMPAYAPSPDKLRKLWHDSGIEVPALVTADDLLASWRHLLHSMTRHAPPEFAKATR